MYFYESIANVLRFYVWDLNSPTQLIVEKFEEELLLFFRIEVIKVLVEFILSHFLVNGFDYIVKLCSADSAIVLISEFLIEFEQINLISIDAFHQFLL